MTSRGYFSSLTKEQEDNALLKKLAVNESSYNRLASLLNRLVTTSDPADLSLSSFPVKLTSSVPEYSLN